MEIRDLTVRQICNCLALINKLEETKVLKFDIDNCKAQLNYDNAMRFLERQNIVLNEIINETIRILKANEQFDLCNQIEEIRKEVI